MQGHKQSHCRSCGAPVIWRITPKGKRTPLDPDPRDDGNIVIADTHELAAALGTVYGRAVTLGGDRLQRARAAPGRDLYVSHWATCPDRQQWRERTDAGESD